MQPLLYAKAMVYSRCARGIVFRAQVTLGKVAVPGDTGGQYHHVWIWIPRMGQGPTMVLSSKGGHL